MNKIILKRIILAGLFIVPFVPFLVSGSFYFPFITTKAFAWRTIVEVVFAAWLVLVAIAPEYRPRKSVILYGVTAFIFIIGLADAFGVAPMKSFWSNYERMEGFVTLLHLGAFLLVISSVFKAKEWKWWWNTSLVASFLMVIYCFSQLSGTTAIHQGGVRVDGTLGNAAYLAVYMLFHVFIALSYFFKEQRNTMLRYTYGLLIILQIVILYFTATRGAILGLIGGLLLIALLNITNKESVWIRRSSVALIGGLILLVGGFYAARHTSFVTSSPVLSRFSNVSVSELKTEGRSFVWPMALKGIMERPILGWGQENFNYVFNAHYDPKMYNLEPWFDRAHNIFLDWGIAGGLLGLLSYLFLYVALLYSIWRKGANPISHVERSVLTGLIAAYFFHNLFVFDHLISYILFIALLGYVHARTLNAGDAPFANNQKALPFVLVPVLVAFVGVFWFVNVKPIIANSSLINGLKAAQTEGTDKTLVLVDLKKSYDSSRLGRPETVEWIASSIGTIYNSTMKDADKNNYFAFAKASVENQAKEFPTDARYQLLAGSFFVQTNKLDEGIAYLEAAKKLIPGKQLVYFQIGAALVVKQDFQGALKVFKEAYDLEPAYKEARVMYLVGAIYAGDAKLVDTLAATLTAEEVATDDRISSALAQTGRLNELTVLLKNRIHLQPTNPQGYSALASVYLKMGDKASAIQILRALAIAIPEAKDQAEVYIKGIQDGSIK